MVDNMQTLGLVECVNMSACRRFISGTLRLDVRRALILNLRLLSSVGGPSLNRKHRNASAEDATVTVTATDLQHLYAPANSQNLSPKP